jgi:hypothetical protein
LRTSQRDPLIGNLVGCRSFATANLPGLKN